MDRLHRQEAFNGKWSAVLRAWCLLAAVLLAVLGVLGWMLVLPLKAGRVCVEAGEWALRAFAACVLGLIGLLILVPLVFGLAYTLLYPWLH